MVLIYSQRCAIGTTLNFRNFASPPKETPYPLGVVPLQAPLSQPLATTRLLYVSMESPIQDTCE